MSSTITALTSGGGLAMAGDTSGQLELKTNNGTTAVTIDTAQTVSTSGKMLVGSSSNPFNSLLYVTGTPTSNQPIFSAYSQGGANVSGIGLYNDAASVGIWSQSGNLTFRTNASLASGSETMRINSSGQLLLGRTTAINAAPFIPSTGQNSRFVSFVNNTVSAEVGYIFCNNDNSTTQYATTSDYRLKQNVQRMAGALNKVTQLNPCTYDWKTGGSSQGFIAHELQEVCPEAVVGTKDQVNEEGNPVYQGIDTSFLVATLTAAIQEQQALITNLTTRLAALEGAK